MKLLMLFDVNLSVFAQGTQEDIESTGLYKGSATHFWMIGKAVFTRKTKVLHQREMHTRNSGNPNAFFVYWGLFSRKAPQKYLYSTGFIRVAQLLFAMLQKYVPPKGN